ncbi:hypothetical protein GCM10010517_39530 [Streptosporangium fragile]|uniref:G-patch domain-containing protein n=1 Tax=Streptosporangium fragile TaxID=46186 RepID=A0ABN3W1T4_9ACTN
MDGRHAVIGQASRRPCGEAGDVPGFAAGGNTRVPVASGRPPVIAAAWSVAEAAPALPSGPLIQAALDLGFLTGHPGAGLGRSGPIRKPTPGCSTTPNSRRQTTTGNYEHR